MYTLIAFPLQQWLHERLNARYTYRNADKSLARPWKETSCSDQDLQHYTKTYNNIPRLKTLYQDLQHYTKTYNNIPRLTTIYQDLQQYTKT